jgi:hypothetical protein
MRTLAVMSELGKRRFEKKMTVRFNMHMSTDEMDLLIDLSGNRKCSGSQLIRELIQEEAARFRTT